MQKVLGTYSWKPLKKNALDKGLGVGFIAVIQQMLAEYTKGKNI